MHQAMGIWGLLLVPRGLQLFLGERWVSVSLGLALRQFASTSGVLFCRFIPSQFLLLGNKFKKIMPMQQRFEKIWDYFAVCSFGLFYMSVCLSYPQFWWYFRFKYLQLTTYTMKSQYVCDQNKLPISGKIFTILSIMKVREDLCKCT